MRRDLNFFSITYLGYPYTNNPKAWYRCLWAMLKEGYSETEINEYFGMDIYKTRTGGKENEKN